MSDTHGRFIWYELMTPDVQASLTFYAGVVGWTSTVMMAGDGDYYILETQGAGVGGMMAFTPEMIAGKMHPSWTGYVAVDDVNATALKVVELGGEVISPPQDIPGIGRFAVITDPAGAAIAVMTPAPMDEPPPQAPADAVGQTGWRELYSGDPDVIFPFYAGLFGWTPDEAHDMGPMGKYQLFSNPDGQVGGMMKRPDHVPTACWMYYVRIGDIDAAAARVKSAGGHVVNGPMEVPGGDWILQGIDPQGAMFCLMGAKAN